MDSVPERTRKHRGCSLSFGCDLLRDLLTCRHRCGGCFRDGLRAIHGDPHSASHGYTEYAMYVMVETDAVKVTVEP